MNQREDGDYIAINAYLPRNADNFSDLQKTAPEDIGLYTLCNKSGIRAKVLTLNRAAP